MIIGVICASGVGASYPVFAYLWGNLIDSFASIDVTQINLGQNSSLVDPEIVQQVAYLGVSTFIAGWGMYTSWRIAGERQAAVCRK
jgi:hypothetical protein